MNLIKRFLAEIDARWTPIGVEPIPLQLIGSAALMLQTDYERGTKDGDVLESRNGPAAIKEQLLAPAGKETALHKEFRVYIDVVTRAILFLPQKPVFHAVPHLRLKNFKVEVLDITDVILSKLKRMNKDDANDISAMVEKGLIDPKHLAKRFEAAVDWFALDARVAELPRYLKNLHRVETDVFGVPPSKIDLPEWQ